MCPAPFYQIGAGPVTKRGCPLWVDSGRSLVLEAKALLASESFALRIASHIVLELAGVL